MKRLLFLATILFNSAINAQDTYTELTENAIQIVRSEDSTNYKIANNGFEKAFTTYPDSINGTGLYYASLLASNLNDKDNAFKYLGTLANMETDEDGYPGWSFVIDDYAAEDYKNLLNDKRWHVLETNALADKK